MRAYEIMFILRPDMTEEDVDRFLAQMETVVSSTGGTVQSKEKWGRRRLAYGVRGHREGYYVLFNLECEPPTVREFERILKVSEPAIKFLTVRIDQELKRLEKLRRKREKREKRRGARSAASAPPVPTAAPEAAV
jgi:small subunit ribosomal protein S6